jgi:hypothetical protein
MWSAMLRITCRACSTIPTSQETESTDSEGFSQRLPDCSRIPATIVRPHAGSARDC